MQRALRDALDHFIAQRQAYYQARTNLRAATQDTHDALAIEDADFAAQRALLAYYDAERMLVAVHMAIVAIEQAPTVTPTTQE